MLSPTIDYTSDPNFVIVSGVPVLDEHELFLPGDPAKGTKDQKIQITPDVLKFICQNNNRRVQSTGDTVQLVYGHTKDDAPENEQPEILGEADQFWVAPLFNTGRQAIFSRWKLSKDPEKLAKMKGATRRSVELWTDRWEIDPIAILKSTPPERDLGVLRLNRMGQKVLGTDGKVHYRLAKYSLPVQYAETSMQPNPVPTPQPITQPVPQAVQPAVPGAAPDPALVQAVASAVMQSDSFVQLNQQMQQMMQQVTQLTQSLAPPPMPGMPGQQPQPGMPAQQPGMGQPDPMAMMLQQLMGGMGQQNGQQQDQNNDGKPDQRDDDDKVRLQGSMPGQTFNPAFPGGGNTFLPTMQQPNRSRDPRIPAMQYQHQNQPAQVPAPQPQPQQLPQPILQPIPQPQPQPGVNQSPMLPGEDVTSALIRLARERDQYAQYSRQLEVFLELSQLQGEGVEFDPQTEAPLLLNLDQNARMQRYGVMRRYYRNKNQQPTGPQIPGIPNVVGQGPVVPQRFQHNPGNPTLPQSQGETVTTEEHNAVVALMVDAKQREGRDLDYRVCLSRVRGARNGYHTGGEPTY